MNKEIINNEKMVMYSTDNLNFINQLIIERLNESLEYYCKLFDIESFRKVQINIFDDKEEFKKYLINLRKIDNMPSYCTATFDNGMVNVYLDPNMEKERIDKKSKCASHELFHIMYKELIWEKENRITWFDEGMAQFFSKEYERRLDEFNFNDWFNNLKNNTKIIPNLNKISHGKTFETKDYSGYKLSLLAVKYLYDTLGENEFKKLLHNNKEIISYGNTIVEDAFEYYEKGKKIKR